MKAHRRLDHRLQAFFFFAVQLTPHVFQFFMSGKKAAGIEELNATLELGGVHPAIVTWRQFLT